MIAAHLLVVAGAALVILSACGGTKEKLVAVLVPNVVAAEPSVREALAEARAQFDKVAARKPSDAELANAYGELAMTYQAHSLVPSAEPAYQNARVLAPQDKRWPYLLGHLYNDAGRMEDAIKAFEAALALDANDAPTLFSLAEVAFQHGDLDKAQSLYERFQARSDDKAAALTGLGKVALAKRQYAIAIDKLEQALKLSPGSSRLRQPLATAYRAMGEQAKAEQNLALYAVDGLEPSIADPAVDAMGAKVASSRAVLRRGQRALDAQRFDVAATAFATAVKSDPKDAKALALLGFSLLNLGKTEEAQRRLVESLALDDDNALAHFSLGIAYDRQGQDEKASEQYEAALKRDPANVDARIYLADARMRMGLPGVAAELYRQAAANASDATRMQFSLAMALVKARRFAEARKVLEAALAAQPRNAAVANALARVLATAPDDSVRDGPRARQLAQEIFESTRHPDVAQTYAMAFAETGQFDKAVSLQEETIGIVDRAGAQQMKPFLTRNLALYKQHKPAREAWAADDPMFQPRNPAVSLAKPAPTS